MKLSFDQKPDIRIWIFNNAIRGITEQLEFLVMTFTQHGYNVTISNKPTVSGLNLIIENLNERTFPEVLKFTSKYNKRVAVVLTEHMDYLNGKILFHGKPFDAPSEYMHALTRRVRLLHLLLARNMIRYFIRLGDLPRLEGINNLFLDIPTITFPYPEIQSQKRQLKNMVEGEYDFIFSGFITSYRKKILERLMETYTVLIPDKKLSRRVRDAANCQAKMVLNIPQDESWRWTSSMRVMAAWRCGRASVNIGNNLEGVLSQFCVNLDGSESFSFLSDKLSKYKSEYQYQLQNYNDYVRNVNVDSFPSEQFHIWSLSELV